MPPFPINCSCIIHGGQMLFFNFLGHSCRSYWTEACHIAFSILSVYVLQKFQVSDHLGLGFLY